MMIDFNYKFVDLDGKNIPSGPPEMERDDDGKMVEKKFPPFTLRKACIDVLVMQERGDGGRPKEISAEEKVKRYMLAQKIYKSTGLVDLQAEEIALLKKLIGRIYPPITVGQSYEILDPHSAEEKK